MRTCLFVLLFSTFSFYGYSQVAPKSAKAPNPNKKLITTEVSCGECNFNLDGKDCDLAIRIDGKAYFVDGVADIKTYGHPHDKNGFCVAIRKAEVQGEIVKGRFKASYFNLLAADN